MKNFKTYLLIGIVSLIAVQSLNAFIIKVINDTDFLINVEAESATYRGWTMFVDAGKPEAKEFGASCPWLIKVSNFFATKKDEEPLPVTLYYGDSAGEQCIEKTLTIRFDENRNKFLVHTDVIARGDLGVRTWKNDWESPDAPIKSKYKSKL